MQNKALDSMRNKLERAGLLPLKSQALLADRILAEKLDSVLPQAMEQTGMDCWVVLGKENSEDPIMKTLFTSDMPHARRISALLFFRDKTGRVRKLSAGPQSPRMSGMYENVKDKDETVWDCIARVIAQCDPARIAVNQSDHYGFCDGISATLRDSLTGCLPQKYAQRVCSGEDVAVAWLQITTDLERSLMQVLVEVTQDIIQYAFSPQHISPGVTTTIDVEWVMRDCISQLDFIDWFGPDVDLQRRGGQSSRLSETVILPGDLLHCDIGMVGKYVQLHSDIQWMAYVRREGEAHAPQGLCQMLALGNRFQDIVTAHFREGQTGNQIFSQSVEAAKAEGLHPMLYSHPLGTFGHGAGPTIGMYDNQSGFVAGSGERRLPNRTCYALELNIQAPLPEWDNQPVFAYLEEDIWFDQTVEYLHGRQTQLMVL